MQPPLLSVKDFAAKIKSKYPEYNGIEDRALVDKILAKYPDYKRQLDPGEFSAPAKKKDESVGGGSSNTTSNIGGTTASQSQSTGYDPVRDALNPLRQQFQQAQSQFDPLRNRAVSDQTRQAVLPVGVKNQQFQESDFNIKQQQEKAANVQLAHTENAIRKAMGNAKVAKSVLDDVKNKNGGVVPKDNEAGAMATQSLNDYKHLSQDIIDNKGIVGAAINEEIKNNPEFANRYKTLDGKIPKSYEGKLLYGYLQRHGENVQNFVEEHPEYKGELDDLMKNFAEKYPETVAAQIGNEVSQAFEKTSHSAADFDTKSFNNAVDQKAAELYKDNPEKLALYNKLVKDNKDKYFKSAAALNSFGGEIFSGLNSTMNTLRDVTGLRDAKDRAYDELDKTATNIDPHATGIRDFVSTGSGFLGMITQIASAGGALKGLGVAKIGAEAVPTITRFYDDQLKQSEGRFGDSWKAKLSADASTAAFAIGGNAIPASKVRGAIENALKDAGEKESVASVRARVFNAVKETYKQYVKGATEMTAITAAQQITDAALGKPHENAGEELLGAAESMLKGNIAPALIHGLGKYAGSKVEEPLKQEENVTTEPITDITTPTTDKTGAEVRDTENEPARTTTTDNGLQDGNSGGGKDVGGEKVEVKPFKKGDGHTKGVFQDSDGNLYKSVQPQEIVQTDKGWERKPIEGAETDEHSILSELQDNPHVPKVGKVVETSEGKAFEMEKLDEVDKFTKDEYRQIQKILDDLNDKGYHVGDRVTVMKRPKTGELVVVDFSAGYKGDRMSRDSEDYMQNIEAKLSPSDKVDLRQEDVAKTDRLTAQTLSRNESPTEYYLTQRPPSIGTHPIEGLKSVEETTFRGRKAWKLTYDRKLSKDEIYNSELTPKITNKEYLGQKISGVFGEKPFYVSDIDYEKGQVKLVSELDGKPIDITKSFKEFQRNLDEGKYKIITDENNKSTESQSNTIKEPNTESQGAEEGEKTSQPIENQGQPPSQKPPVEEGIGQEKTTGIKNEQTKAEREQRGLPEVEVEVRRKFGQAFDEGKRMVDSGELNPKALAKELAVRPRPLSAEESAALIYDRMRIMNEHQKVMDDIQKAVDNGEEVKASVLQSELARVEDEMNLNDEASRKTGYEQGLGLAARKMMIKQDYSMANLVQRARTANGGKEIPTEVREKLKDLSQKLEEANKKIDDYEKQIAELKAKRQAQTQKNKETVERLRGERKKIKEDIAKKWKNAGNNGNLNVSIPYATQLMAIAPDVAKLVKNYAHEGVVELSEIINNIHKDLSEHIPEISKDDVSDLVLGKYDSQKEKATPSPEKIRLQANVAKVKSQINKEILKLKLADRGWMQKGMDWLHGWHRFSILSGIPTLGKIGTAALGRGVTTRAEDLVGGVLSKIPGISKIAQGAERHGGFSSIKAEAKAFTTWFDKMTWQDIREIMRSGESELDYLYGEKPEYISKVPTWMDFFGKLHQAIKTLPKRAEFFRSMEIRTQKALKEGKNLSDPIVQQELGVAAYNDAIRQIFMSDNWVTDMYKDMLRGLQNKANRDGTPNSSARLAANIMQFMFPIIKVPTNYVGEATSYMFGGLKGAFALRKGIKDLTPDQRDYVMRMFKKQTVGAAFIALGYLNPQAFGGYYSGKRKPDDLEAGDIELFGVKVPHWMAHTPLLEALQVGATIRRARDEAQAKRKPVNLLTGLHTVLSGVGEQIPFMSTGGQVGDATKSIDNAKKYFFRLGQSVVEPQLMQNVAKWNDTDAKGDPVKRDPKTFIETLESGVPKLRNTLPERAGHNAELMKKPTFKYYYDKGLNIPNTVPSSIKIKDYNNKITKSLSEYPQETQDKFINNRHTVLEKYLQESKSKGVLVDQFGNVAINPSKDPKIKQTKKRVDDLTTEQLTKLLSIQGKRATHETKKKMFNDDTEDENE